MSQAQSYRKGYTVIEILIVLAIVGLIMALIFLAVPTLRKNYRNYARKEAATYVMSAMDQYRNEFNHYPLTNSSDNRTAFIDQLAGEGTARNFEIRYTTNNGSHEYPYRGGDSPADYTEAYDQISIEHGHVCNRAPGLVGGDTDFPLKSAPGSTGDQDYSQFTVWTILENNIVYCLDNQN